MSTFYNRELKCPHCEKIETYYVAQSISGIRATQHREAILENRFQINNRPINGY